MKNFLLRLKIFENQRIVSVIPFALLFGCLLSFPFEGQVLYELLKQAGIGSDGFIFSAIIAHLAGLVSCGWIAAPFLGCRKTMLFGAAGTVLGLIPFFFFSLCKFWLIPLIIMSFCCGLFVAAWGWYLKNCTPRHERYRTTADVLIWSNAAMIAANSLAVLVSPRIGLTASFLLAVGAFASTFLLPPDRTSESRAQNLPAQVSPAKPAAMLCLFVVILTVNSGLMYQVFNPAYAHLGGWTAVYWAVPYVAALVIMRKLLQTSNRPYFLYVGMAMITGAFVTFMFAPRTGGGYLAVDTLMLGACGIFDLFWWSIIGELLDYARNPARIMGVCIASNVAGVLAGGLVGELIFSSGAPASHTAVIALVIVCVTTALLPWLNSILVRLLKNNVYLFADPAADREKPLSSPAFSPLSAREKEVLNLLLEARTNREIAAALSISEHTVKTHVKNIFSKYNVSGRMELASAVRETPSAAARI